MLGVKKEIKVRDRAQREQRRKRDPRTARALDKENKTLKRLNKTVRDEIFKGKLDRIITADDMSRLAKYAKKWEGKGDCVHQRWRRHPGQLTGGGDPEPLPSPFPELHPSIGGHNHRQNGSSGLRKGHQRSSKTALH